jgi:hypothetical protein
MYHHFLQGCGGSWIGQVVTHGLTRTEADFMNVQFRRGFWA